MHRLFALGLAVSLCCLTAVEADQTGRPKNRGMFQQPPPPRFVPPTRIAPVQRQPVTRPVSPSIPRPIPTTTRPAPGRRVPDPGIAGPGRATLPRRSPHIVPPRPTRPSSPDLERLQQENARLHRRIDRRNERLREVRDRETAIRNELINNLATQAYAARNPIVVPVQIPVAAGPAEQIEQVAQVAQVVREAPAVARMPVQDSRFLRIQNNSASKLTIFVQVGENDRPIRLVLESGERSLIYDDNAEKVAARQVFLWAESSDGTKFEDHKNNALVLADVPYRARAIEAFTYTFE